MIERDEVERLPEFEDPDVQAVYKLLTDDTLPDNPNAWEEHWEGWTARHIVKHFAARVEELERERDEARARAANAYEDAAEACDPTSYTAHHASTRRRCQKAMMMPGTARRGLQDRALALAVHELHPGRAPAARCKIRHHRIVDRRQNFATGFLARVFDSDIGRVHYKAPAVFTAVSDRVADDEHDPPEIHDMTSCT
ncbi:hypothetical protein P6F26_16935 [Roseibacterium sp. SDUM158017]|uniref:hypothetical protein n=1 Tax=Roseicyclus salinarum TaxID=3036773 RepID=UPI0024154EBC|nr:hypothetical protein [Roseibacterium sp. SDUM158017]MDG4650136.1 hypothetical protein [Roseibacterium sp. SDUM158017]